MAGNKQVTIGINLEFHGFDRQSLENEIGRVEQELKNMANMELDAEIEISEDSLGRFEKITQQLEEVVNDLNEVSRKLRTEDITITVEGQAIKKVKNNVENAFNEGLSRSNMDGGDGDGEGNDGMLSRSDRQSQAQGMLDQLERNSDLVRRSIQRFTSSMTTLGSDDAPGEGRLQSQLGGMNLGDKDRKATLQQFSATRQQGAKRELKNVKKLSQAAQRTREEFQFLLDTAEENSDEAERFQKKLREVEEVQIELEDEQRQLQRIVDESRDLEKIISRTERSQQEVESLIRGAADQVQKSLKDISSSNIDSFLEPFSQMSRQLGQDLRLLQRRAEKTQNDLDELAAKRERLKKQSDTSKQEITQLREQEEQLQEVKNALDEQIAEVRRWKTETTRATDKLKSMQAVLGRNEKFIEEANKSAREAGISMKRLGVTFERLQRIDSEGDRYFNKQELQQAEESFQQIDNTISELRQNLNKIDVARNLEKKQLRDMANATRNVNGEERKGLGPFAEEGFDSEEARQKKVQRTLENVDKKYDELSETLRNDLSKAQEMAQSDAKETAEQMARHSKKIIELEENVKNLNDDIDRLGKSHKELTSAQAENTQQLINQAKRADEAKQEYENIVSKIQKYEAELERLTQEGEDSTEQTRELRQELERAREAMRGRAMSADEMVESGKMQAQAKALKEVREGVTDTAQEVGRLEQRFERAYREMQKGGDQSAEAAREMEKLGSKYESVRDDVRRYISVLEQAKQNGRELTDQEQRMLRTSRELISRTRKKNRYLQDNADKFDKVRQAQQRANGVMNAYTDELAESVRKNFQFISAIGIVASALFGLQMAFEEILEESRALTRALTVMESNSMSFEETINSVQSAVRSTAVEFGERVDEVSEVVFQLGSAGLSTEESLAGLNNVMQLIVGTEAEAQEATKAVAGAFNVFAEQMDKLNTKQAKFQRITDTMIKVFRDHQVEMQEVIQGLEYSSAAASAAGFSFQETAGFLAVLNDNMIKGGKAGRGLQNVMSKLSRQTDTLQNVFDIEVDDTMPLSDQFLDILDQFSERLGEGALSVEELRNQFKLAGLRGGRTFSILVQNIDDVKETLTELKEESKGAGDRVRDIVEQSLIQQFERAKQALLEIVRQGLDPVISALSLGAAAFEELEEGLSILGPFRDFIVVLGIVGGSVTILVQSFSALTKVLAVLVNDYILLMIGKFIRLVSSGQLLSTIMGKLNAVWSYMGKVLNTVKVALTGTGQRAKLARDALFGTSTAARTASGSIGMLATAVGALLAAIPIIITAIGYFNTSVKELKRNMEQAGNEIDNLTNKQNKLEDFGERLNEISNLSGTITPSVAGDKIRKELKKLGKDTINTTDILLKSDSEIGNSMDQVTQKLKNRIEARKRLLELQKEQERQKFVESLEGRVEALASGTSGWDNLFGLMSSDIEGNADMDIASAFSGFDEVRQEVEFYNKALEGGLDSLQERAKLQSLLAERGVADSRLTEEEMIQKALNKSRKEVKKYEKDLKSLATTYQTLKSSAETRQAIDELNAAFKENLNEEQWERLKQLAQETMEEGVRIPTINAKDEMEQLIGTYQTLTSEMEVSVSPRVITNMINGFRDVDQEIKNLQERQEDFVFDPFEGENVKDMGFSDLFNFDGGMLKGQVSPLASVADFINIETNDGFKNKAKSLVDSWFGELKSYMQAQGGQISIGQEVFQDAFLPENLESLEQESRERIAKNLRNLDGRFGDIGKQIKQRLIESIDSVDNESELFAHFQNDGVEMLKEFSRNMDEIEGNAKDFQGVMTQVFEGTAESLDDMFQNFNDWWSNVLNEKGNVMIDEEQRKRMNDWIDNLRIESRVLATINDETKKQEELQKKINERRLQRERMGGAGTQPILNKAREKLETALENEKDRTKAIKQAVKWAEERLKVELETSAAVKEQRVRHMEMENELQKSVDTLDNISHKYHDIDSLIDNQVKKQGKSVDQMIELLDAQEKFQGGYHERHEALNSLVGKQKELVELRRELVQSFKEETSLRYDLIASAEEALNPEKERAGLAAKVQSSVSKISALKAKEGDISKRIESGSKNELQLKRMKRAVQQEIVDESSNILDMENKLEEKMKEVNQEVLDRRLELLQEILESLKRQSERAGEQVSRGLERSLDVSGLQKFARAGKVAELTGRSLGDVMANTKRATDELKKALKDGEVSVNQFMQAVGDERFRSWAEEFHGVNEQIDEMQKKLRDLRKKEIQTAAANFENFLASGNIEQARSSMEKFGTLTSELLKNEDPELFRQSRRALLDMQKSLSGLEKSKTQRKLENIKQISGYQRLIRSEVERIRDARVQELATLKEMFELIESGEFGDGLSIGVRRESDQEQFNTRLQELDNSILQLTNVIEKNSEYIANQFYGVADKFIRAIQNMVDKQNFVQNQDAKKKAEKTAGSVEAFTKNATEKKEGGYIPGFGGGDKVPAKLERGEFVMPKEAVEKFGVPFFEMLRRGQMPKFQEGGPVATAKSKIDSGLEFSTKEFADTMDKAGQDLKEAIDNVSENNKKADISFDLNKFNNTMTSVREYLEIAINKVSDVENDTERQIDSSFKRLIETNKSLIQSVNNLNANISGGGVNTSGLLQGDSQSSSKLDELKEKWNETVKGLGFGGETPSNQKDGSMLSNVKNAFGFGSGGETPSNQKDGSMLSNVKNAFGFGSGGSSEGSGSEEGKVNSFVKKLNKRIGKIGKDKEGPKAFTKVGKQVQAINKELKKIAEKNPLLDFVVNKLPKKFEQSVNKISGMISESLASGVESFTGAITSFAKAREKLSESLEDIAIEFNDQVDNAQDGLRRNKNSYFQYLDSVDKAEEQRIQSRLKAEEKYQEKLKDIEKDFGKEVVGIAEDFTSKLVEGASKIPDLFVDGLGSIAKQALGGLSSGGRGNISSALGGSFGGSGGTSGGSGGGVPKAGGGSSGGGVGAKAGAVGQKGGEVAAAGADIFLKTFRKTFTTLMQGFISSLSTLFKMTLENDEKLIDKIDNFITDLPQKIEDVTGRLSENIDRLSETFIKQIPEMGRQFVLGLSGVLSKIGNVLSSDEFQNALDQFLKDLPKLLKESLLPALESVLSGLIEIMPKVAEFVQQFFASLAEFIQSDKFQAFAKTLGDVIGDIIGSLMLALPDILVGLIDAIATMLPQLVRSIVKNLDEILYGIARLIVVALFKLPIMFMKVLITSVYQALIGFAQAIGWDDAAEFLKNLPKDIWNEMKDFFNNLWNDIVSGFKSIVNAINPAKKPDGSDSFLKDAGDWFKQAGKDIGNFMGFHTGGVIKEKSDLTKRDDEVPIMAQTGEGVLSRKGMEALGGVDVLRQLNQGKNPYVDNANGELRKFGREKHFRKRRQRVTQRVDPPSSAPSIDNNMSQGSSGDTPQVRKSGQSVNVDIGKVVVEAGEGQDGEELADEFVEEVDSKLTKLHKNKKSDFGKEIEEDDG